MDENTAAPLRVTAEDLARARPPDGPPPRPPRVSQLAVASLAIGLLGIPLVGVLLGPIAICCGVLAVGAVRRRDGLGGLGLAVAGIAIGTLELVAWTAGLVVLLSRPVAPAAQPPVTAAARSVSGIADAPPHIRRALRANALVRCRSPQGGEALGSGVVVGSGGGAWLLLTNRHVVDCAGPKGEATLTAATPGGTERTATVAWRAPEEIDAALLRVEGDGAPEPAALALGAGAPPRVGDAVFVVGNPLGYEATYTAGVLSAMRSAAWGPHRLRVFQVQASVNPGNSGGGLYDAGGHLIGLVTWTAAKDVAEGLGFAIATDDVLALLREGAPRDVAALVAGGEGGGSKP